MKEFSVSCWACPYDAEFWYATDPVSESSGLMSSFGGSDRIPSTTPGAEPPRDAEDSGSARSHPTHLETSSSNRP